MGNYYNEGPFWMLIPLLIYGAIIVIVALLYILRRGRKKIEAPCKLLVIIGSGGHTSEMLKIVSALNFSLYNPRLYVLTRTDSLSRSKVEEMEKNKGTNEGSKGSHYEFITIQRVREVGQSWISTIKAIPEALWNAFVILLKTKPNLVLANGPGICVPFIVASVILRWFLFLHTNLVYVESICRVKSLSLSGKILLPFVDTFVVQWPELEQRLRKRGNNVVYFGRLC